MPCAYIGLGSNLGNRRRLLSRALELLETPGLEVTLVSPLYETEPVGGPPQGKFLNACAALATVLPPILLLRRLLAVEDALGRVRRERWGPRTADLDLLVYEDVAMHTPLLELPHPRLAERDFVLRPLSDIAPDLEIPGTGRTVRRLLVERPDSHDIRLFQENWR